MSKFKKGDEVVIIGPAKMVGIKHSLLSTGSVLFDGEDGTFYVAGDCREDHNWWYESHNLQLKKEYDMQNKTETKRIPFDLERAMKGDKIINSNGQPVRIICFDRCVGDKSLPLVALHNEHGCEVARYHFKNGCETCEDEFNLFMAPVEKTGWIGIFERRVGDICDRVCTNIFNSESVLMSDIKCNWDDRKLICTKQITWEE